MLPVLQNNHHPLIWLSCLFLLAFLSQIEADDRKTAADLIRSRGFNLDEFEVVSQNYVLKLYRIINPLADPKTLHKIPVVLAHGISWDAANMMSSSKLSRPRKPIVDERVTLYAMENGTDDKGLHFYLSNNNYDCWLIEARGTSDRVMRRLSDGPNNKTFWDFSLDEQALIDLPLQLNFVLMKTRAPKLAYVAYSQSTTMMFALLSMKPEFSEKLSTFVAMAPVVFTSHMKGLIAPLIAADIFLNPSSANAYMPSWYRKLQNTIVTYACSISFIKYSLCRLMWKEIAGPDKSAVLDGGVVENMLKATSMKSYEQYIHNGLIGDFRMYDYKDEMRNLEEYGQVVPPQYNVSKINLKTIVLFRGTADYLSDPMDQMILLSRLRVPLYEDHVLEDYGHIDFIVSPTVTRDINEPILRVIDKSSNRTVNRVRHTLGDPNPQVVGTPLVIDTKKDLEQVKDKVRAHSAGTAGGFPSQPKAERPLV